MGKLAGLARMTTLTTGTGTVTLLAAVTDRLTFALAGINNGDTVSYGLVDLGNGNVEMGEGVYASAGPTLTRPSIEFSTNGGAAISISASGAEVFITPLNKDFGLRKIDKKSFSGVSEVTFSNIPQHFSHLEVIAAGRSDAGSSPGVPVNMTFNGDTSGIYHYHGRQIVNAAEGDNIDDATTNVPMGLLPWSGATAGLKGFGHAIVVDYADTTLFKTGFYTRHSIGATTLGASWVTSYSEGFDYGSASAITSLTLTLALGNGVAGSSAWLYGLL